MTTESKIKYESSLTAWLESSETTGLIVAIGALPIWGRNQAARDLLRRAYLAGYAAKSADDGANG